MITTQQWMCLMVAVNAQTNVIARRHSLETAKKMSEFADYLHNITDVLNKRVDDWDWQWATLPDMDTYQRSLQAELEESQRRFQADCEAFWSVIQQGEQ